MCINISTTNDVLHENFIIDVYITVLHLMNK